MRTKQHPAGLSKYRLAPAISERRVPSISERWPPVTRLRILVIVAGPVNVALPSGHVKLAKAVKEIAAPGLPQLSADSVVRPGQRPWGPETAVQGHLGLTNSEQHDEQHAATQEQGTAEEPLQGRRFGAGIVVLLCVTACTHG